MYMYIILVDQMTVPKRKFGQEKLRSPLISLSKAIVSVPQTLTMHFAPLVIIKSTTRRSVSWTTHTPTHYLKMNAYGNLVVTPVYRKNAGLI